MPVRQQEKVQELLSEEGACVETKGDKEMKSTLLKVVCLGVACVAVVWGCTQHKNTTPVVQPQQQWRVMMTPHPTMQGFWKMTITGPDGDVIRTLNIREGERVMMGDVAAPVATPLPT